MMKRIDTLPPFRTKPTRYTTLDGKALYKCVLCEADYEAAIKVEDAFKECGYTIHTLTRTSTGKPAFTYALDYATEEMPTSKRLLEIHNEYCNYFEKL